jgi:hypothetical protein
MRYHRYQQVPPAAAVIGTRYHPLIGTGTYKGRAWLTVGLDHGVLGVVSRDPQGFD